MSNEITPAAARALVESVAEDHGYIAEEDLATMTPRVRKLVENVIKKKDTVIATGVQT